jgi:hypothetical protein
MRNQPCGVESLKVSISPMGTHVWRIYEKLHVHSPAQAEAKFADATGRAPQAWRPLIVASKRCRFAEPGHIPTNKPNQAHEQN